MWNAAPRTVPDTRFACGGCTACCRHFALGPVEPAVVARLTALEIGRDWSPAAAGFAVRRPGPDGAEGWFLTRRPDGACVFLRDDGLCAVHALHGEAAKPAFCREYPFMVIAEPTGPAVVVRGDCGGWADSFATAPTAASQADAILALPRAHPPGALRLDPIPLVPGVGIGPEQIALVDAALAPLLAADAPPLARPEHLIGALADALYALVGRPRPPADPIRTEAALAACADHLAHALRAAVRAPPSDDPEIRGMVAFLTEALALVDSGATLRPRPLDPSASAYLRLVLHNELAGRLFQPWGGLPPWLGGAALGVRLASAAAPGDGPISARDLGPGLATFIRLTRHAAAQRLLASLRAPLTDVFVHSQPRASA